MVFELAFAGDAFEGLFRIFDPILVISAIRGQQLHHLIGAVGHHVADRAGREVDDFTDLKLVLFQRGSPGTPTTWLRSWRATAPDPGGTIAAHYRDCLKKSVFSGARACLRRWIEICRDDKWLYENSQVD